MDHQESTLHKALYDLLTAVEEIHEPDASPGDVSGYWVAGNVGRDVVEAAREVLLREGLFGFECGKGLKWTSQPKSDSSVALLDRQKRDLATAIYDAWVKYTDFFGEPPHGTLKQMNALVELMRLDLFVQEIGNRAVSRWYAEGQGAIQNPHETDSDGDGE